MSGLIFWFFLSVLKMQFKPFATLGNMFDILYIYVAIATQYWVVYFVAIAPLFLDTLHESTRWPDVWYLNLP